MDGISRAHLQGAAWEECDLTPFWDAVVRALMSDSFPRFHVVGELFKGKFQ